MSAATEVKIHTFWMGDGVVLGQADLSPALACPRQPAEPLLFHLHAALPRHRCSPHTTLVCKKKKRITKKNNSGSVYRSASQAPTFTRFISVALFIYFLCAAILPLLSTNKAQYTLQTTSLTSTIMSDARTQEVEKARLAEQAER